MTKDERIVLEVTREELAMLVHYVQEAYYDLLEWMQPCPSRFCRLKKLEGLSTKLGNAKTEHLGISMEEIVEAGLAMELDKDQW